MHNRRVGAGPVPSLPELYVNERQVHGLIVLKKFGWKLVCIRRSNDLNPEIILRNKVEGAVGFLESDGILRLSNDLRIRERAKFEPELSDNNTNELIQKYQRCVAPGHTNIEL